MSNNSPNHYGSKFSNQVRHYYQQMFRKLRHTVDTREQVTDAKDLTFFRMGRSASATRARGASLAPQNQDMPTVTVTPDEISGMTFVDRKDEKRMTYRSVDQFAKSQGADLARKSDGLIIAAGYAGAAANTTGPLDYTGSDANLNHLLQVEAIMGELDVPDDDIITVLVSPTVFNNWMLFEPFSNRDWVFLDQNMGKTMTRFKAKDWNGLHIIPHTGLTSTGYSAPTDTVNCLAYHKSAIGYASLDETRIETASTLGNNKPGTNIYGFIDAGAVAIDPEGIIQFNMRNHITV